MKRLIKVTLEFKEVEYIPRECLKCGLDCIEACGANGAKLKGKGE